MSKRPIEEPMNYFDEYVSISTFSSYDFSVQHQRIGSVVATPVGTDQIFPCKRSSAATNDHLNHNKVSIQRIKMSKHLREEAKNYFDENVMNPYVHLIVPFSQLQRIHTLARLLLANQIFPCKSSSASTTYCSDYHLNHNKPKAQARAPVRCV